MIPATNGKTLKKKLLLSMTVGNVKALCAKLFKAEILAQKLTYFDSVSGISYELEEDLRQLSFYGLCDGGQVTVELK